MVQASDGKTINDADEKNCSNTEMKLLRKMISEYCSLNLYILLVPKLAPHVKFHCAAGHNTGMTRRVGDMPEVANSTRDKAL